RSPRSLASFLPCSRDRWALPSFPTRRSSDLGYGGASIRSIAQKTGVSLSAMYYHYASKQELLAAMLNAGMDSFEGRVTEEFEAKDRKSTRLNSSHVSISYAVFCLKKKNE